MDSYQELNNQMIAKMREFIAAIDRKNQPAVERLDGEVKELLDQMRADVRKYVSANRLGTSH